jgi:hypothetical protein
MTCRPAEICRQIGGSARGYLGVGGASQQSGMAYWMVAYSVYLYIAILGANVRICRESVGWLCSPMLLD